MRIQKDHVVEAERVFAEFGVAEYRFEPVGVFSKKHPGVVFTINGVELRVMMSASKTCWGARQATRVALRRLCRLHSGADAVR